MKSVKISFLLAFLGGPSGRSTWLGSLPELMGGPTFTPPLDGMATQPASTATASHRDKSSRARRDQDRRAPDVSVIDAHLLVDGRQLERGRPQHAAGRSRQRKPET